MTTTAPPATSVKRIAIVDDHTMMREGVSTFIDNLDGFTTAWQAVDCADTIRQLEKDIPDVIMVDITLPDRNGLELIKDIRMLAPKLPILVLSMHDEKLYAPRALKAGAQGYLMKDAPHQDIERALRKISLGGMAVSEAMSENILAVFSSGKPRSEEAELHELSDREFEVFQMIGEGRSTHQIATILRISPKTVDVHRLKIRNKLRLGTGTELTAHAIRWIELKKLAGS